LFIWDRIEGGVGFEGEDVVDGVDMLEGDLSNEYWCEVTATRQLPRYFLLIMDMDISSVQ
jgi:hypothetical protein